MGILSWFNCKALVDATSGISSAPVSFPHESASRTKMALVGLSWALLKHIDMPLLLAAIAFYPCPVSVTFPLFPLGLSTLASDANTSAIAWDVHAVGSGSLSAARGLSNFLTRSVFSPTSRELLVAPEGQGHMMAKVLNVSSCPTTKKLIVIWCTEVVCLYLFSIVHNTIYFAYRTL